MKLDPLIKESIKNILWGTIFALSVLLSAGVIRWFISFLSLEGMLVDWLEKGSLFGSLFIYLIFIIKSGADMIYLLYKSIKKTWKK